MQGGRKINIKLMQQKAFNLLLQFTLKLEDLAHEEEYLFLLN